MLNKLLLELRYCFLAIGFFTRLPVPTWDDYQDAYLNYAAKYFPLVGILVGALGALAYWLSHHFMPESVAILISMAATVYMTGAFHEDGLADSADGFGGGWHCEQVLNIMVDSRLGTYGAVALFFVLFAKFHLLISLPPSYIPCALIIGHALSRLCAVWLMATLNYAKPSGKAKPLATKISFVALCFASLMGLLPLVAVIILFNQTWVFSQIVVLMIYLIVPVLICWCWWRHHLKRRLNGYTGDTLGAMQQITELAFYLGLLLWSANH